VPEGSYEPDAAGILLTITERGAIGPSSCYAGRLARVPVPGASPCAA
jgi:hypothetical protein